MTDYNLLELVEVRVNQLAAMSIMAVGDQPQVGVEGLCRLVVQRVEEVHPVLVCFVGEVGKQALMNQVVQLLLCYLQRNDNKDNDHKLSRIV